MKKLLLTITSLALLSSLSAQIDVTHEPIIPFFIDQIVGDATVVSGVMVNGVAFDMINLQAGTFSDPSQTMGISSGIILGTGDVTMAEQPNISTSGTVSGNQDNYSDSDLESLSGGVSVNDQILLEFDFVALGDSVFMEYVFASEEYPEYVCSVFNDVMGVFLSGPNPDGGNYASEQISLIPDPVNPSAMTTTNVAINTLNPGVDGGFGSEACDELDPNWTAYSVYYVENTDTLYEYDGRTVVLPIRWAVVPGELYHMKIGVGDGSDGAFDSAFLLKSNSFKTASASPNGIIEAKQLELSVFPNPATDFVTITSEEAQLSQATMSVKDLQGKMLTSSTWTTGTPGVDVSDLDAGVYILTLISADGAIYQQSLTVK